MRYDTLFAVSIILGITCLAIVAGFYEHCRLQSWVCVIDIAYRWQTLIGALTAVITASIGAAVTISAANKQLMETLRPYVVAKLSIADGSFFMLDIVNIGKLPAKNMILRMDRDFYSFGDGENIRDNSAFRSITPSFAPGEKLSFYLSQGFNLDNNSDGIDKTPKSFTIYISYEFKGNTYKDDYPIELVRYFGAAAIKTSDDHLLKISEYLEKMERQLEGMRNNLRRN